MVNEARTDGHPTVVVRISDLAYETIKINLKYNKIFSRMRKSSNAGYLAQHLQNLKVRNTIIQHILFFCIYNFNHDPE